MCDRSDPGQPPQSGLSLAQSVSEAWLREIDLTLHLVDVIGLLMGVPVALRSVKFLLSIWERNGELRLKTYVFRHFSRV